MSFKKEACNIYMIVITSKIGYLNSTVHRRLLDKLRLATSSLVHTSIPITFVLG